MRSSTQLVRVSASWMSITPSGDATQGTEGGRRWLFLYLDRETKIVDLPYNTEDAMIRFGKQIRLTPTEVDRVTEITGLKPVGVKTIEDLNAYIEYCKQYCWGGSKEA